MPLYSNIRSSLIAGSIGRYLSASNKCQNNLTEIESSSKSNKVKHVSAEEAYESIKDSRLGVSDSIKDLLRSKFGSNFFKKTGDEHHDLLVTDRLEALKRLEPGFKKLLMSQVIKVYAENLRTPDLKRITLKRLIGSTDSGGDEETNENDTPGSTNSGGDKVKYKRDTSFRDISVDIPGTDIGKQLDFSSCFNPLSKVSESFLDGLKADSFKRISNNKQVSYYVQKKPFELTIGDKDLSAKYLIEVANIGELLENTSNIGFNPNRLDDIKALVSNFHLYFKGNLDLDDDGSGILSLDKSLAQAYYGDEEGSSFDKIRSIESVFAPRIDASRLDQLKSKYGISKKAFTGVDDNLSHMDIEDLESKVNVSLLKVGDPDTLLVEELRKNNTIKYVLDDKIEIKDKTKSTLVVRFPSLEASGFLSSGQKYRVQVSSIDNLKIGEEYTWRIIESNTPRSNSLHVLFVEQTEAVSKESIDTLLEGRDDGEDNEIGADFTGKDIQKLSRHMIYNFTSALRTAPRDKMAEAVGSSIVVRGMAIGEGGNDLSSVIKDEDDEIKKPGSNLKRTDGVDILLEEHEEEDKQKEQSTRDVYGDYTEIADFILSRGLERKDSRLFNFIFSKLPSVEGKKSIKLGILTGTKEFSTWIIDIIAEKASGLPESKLKSELWQRLAIKKIEDGTLFKEVPAIDEAYSGPRNTGGGAVTGENTARFFSKITDSYRDIIIDGLVAKNPYLTKLIGFSKEQREGLEKAEKDFKAKYHGGIDSKGNKLEGLDKAFKKALETSDGVGLEKILFRKGEYLSKEDHKALKKISDGGYNMSPKNMRFFSDKYSEIKKMEYDEMRKNVISRGKKPKSVVPETPVTDKLASFDRATTNKIISMVMSRRGYYNV